MKPSQRTRKINWKFTLTILQIETLLILLVSGSYAESTTATPTPQLTADRRVSYTTNVVHGDPKYPDQQAQSSIDFKLGDSDDDNEPHQSRGVKPSIFQYTTPKSIKDYQQSSASYESSNYLKSQTVQPKNQQSSSQPSRRPSSDYQKAQTPSHHQVNLQLAKQPSYKHSVQRPVATPSSRQVEPQKTYTQISYPYGQKSQPTYKTYAPNSQSQSFNVGYSVKFTNGNDRGKPYKAPRYESDVITGVHKEKVKKPPSHYASSEESKYDSYSASVETKPKYSLRSPTPTSLPKQILSQAHVTPKTQKHLAYLETVHSTNKYQQDKNANAATKTPSNSPWTNLSPSVEIYRSQEIDVPQKYQSSFDHERALGKSEGFDYTNAVEFAGIQAANHHKYYDKSPSNSYDKNDEDSYDKEESDSYGKEARDAYGKESINSYNVQASSPYGKQQLSTHSQRFPMFSPSGLKSSFSDYKSPTALPKLPIDTSLLREPVLTIHKQNLNIDSKQLPIHFDTSLIQEMGKQYGQLFATQSSSSKFKEPIEVYDASSSSSKAEKSDEEEQADSSSTNHHLNVQQFNNLLTEQSKDSPMSQLYQKYTQLREKDPLGIFSQQSNLGYKNAEQEIKLKYQQKGGLFNPGTHKTTGEHKQKPKMYMVQENVQETNQPQAPSQFKVFGKPSNTFMRHEYEKHQKGSSSLPPRQPRINPKRTIRDYSIETDLKPPPMPFKRYRRMHQVKYAVK